MRAGLCRISGLAHAHRQSPEMEGPPCKGAFISQGHRRVNGRETDDRFRWPRPRANNFFVSAAAAHLSPEAKATLPRHVAIIMDGNGRWARERHLPRIEGHRAGADSARIIIRTAGELGIKYLTLYAFSVENWNRPKDEVDALMKYLIHYLKSETPELNKNNVRLEVSGQIYRLPELVRVQ